MRRSVSWSDTRRCRSPPRSRGGFGCGYDGATMTALVWGGVVLLGGVGAVLRFLVDRSISGRLGRLFPYGTLVVNVSGAAILGVITGLALGHTEALLAGTATIGAYTPFSTWMFATQRLAEDRQVVALGANIVVSLVVGLVAAGVGRWLGGLW